MMDDLNENTAAARLRAARTKAGHATAAAASRAHDWPLSRYRHHENGTRGFDNDHAKAYAEAYNVSAAWLMGLKAGSSPEFDDLTRFWINEAYEIQDADIRRIDGELTEKIGITLLPETEIGEFGIMATGYDYFSLFHAFDASEMDRLKKVSKKRLYVVRNRGREMEPLLRDNALIVVDTGDQSVDRQDQIWALAYGEAGCSGVCARIPTVAWSALLRAGTLVQSGPPGPNSRYSAALFGSANHCSDTYRIDIHSTSIHIAPSPDHP